MVKRATAILLMALPSCGGGNVQHIEDVVEDRSLKNPTFSLGVACSDDSSPSKLESLLPFPSHGTESCVRSISPPVGVSGLRFIPSKQGYNRIVLMCDETALSALERPKPDRMYLIIEGKIDSEIVAFGAQGREACTLNLGGDMVDALTKCESIADQFGFDAGGCTKVCGSEDDRVCVPVR